MDYSHLHLCVFCATSNRFLAAVNRYFVLTGDDLEDWAQEPEAFHHEQEMVQWREKLRPCGESLYLALFERHREVRNCSLS